MESGQKYPSDLTDRQWQVMRQLFPPRNRRGRRSEENRQCHPIWRTNWMPVANAAPRLSQLEYGLRNLLKMAGRRNMAKDPRRVARESAKTEWKEIESHRPDHRQPVDSHRRGWHRTWL